MFVVFSIGSSVNAVFNGVILVDLVVLKIYDEIARGINNTVLDLELLARLVGGFGAIAIIVAVIEEI